MKKLSEIPILYINLEKEKIEENIWRKSLKIIITKG